MNFRKEIETAINRASKENGSNTPDFILAEYLEDCLKAFDKAVTKRDKWNGTDEKFDYTLSGSVSKGIVSPGIADGDNV